MIDNKEVHVLGRWVREGKYRGGMGAEPLTEASLDPRWRTYRGLAVYVLVKGEVPYVSSGSGKIVHVGIATDLGRRVYMGMHTKGAQALPFFTRVWWREFRDSEVEEACEVHRRLHTRLQRTWGFEKGLPNYGPTKWICELRLKGERPLQRGHYRGSEKLHTLIPTREEDWRVKRVERMRADLLRERIAEALKKKEDEDKLWDMLVPPEV